LSRLEAAREIGERHADPMMDGDVDHLAGEVIGLIDKGGYPDPA
jgi:hypothetical protein